LVTDDLDARRAAHSLGVAVTGSIGVLVAGIKAGLITLKEGNLLLNNMVAAGFRSPVRSLDDFLELGSVE
jgi:predicted nucleic acid-binding protein